MILHVMSSYRVCAKLPFDNKLVIFQKPKLTQQNRFCWF